MSNEVDELAELVRSIVREELAGVDLATDAQPNSKLDSQRELRKIINGPVPPLVERLPEVSLINAMDGGDLTSKEMEKTMNSNKTIDKGFAKLAIEDVRARHGAIVALIYFIDTQALGLLRLYVTLASGFAAVAVSVFSQQENGFGALVAAVLAATASLVVASYFCLLAMKSSTINLPGRDADFWVWAGHPDVAEGDVVPAYFKELQAKIDMNRAVNVTGARHLWRAKLVGMFTPVLALLAGGLFIALV